MDQNNQNQPGSLHPFGAYERQDGVQNRPRDISSDLWTPISTGVPMPGTAKLVDENEQPEHPQDTRPVRKKSGGNQKKKPQKKQSEKKRVQNSQEDPSAAQRPVVRQPQRRPAPRQTQKARAGKEQRRQMTADKQYEKSKQEYESQRSRGRSSDEIRRTKAKKKRRSKRLIAIVTVSVIMVLAGIFAFVYCYVYGAPIETITVEGKSPYTSADIIAASGVRIGDNMLRVRKKELSRQVSGLLPYIASVKVDYQLPDTLLLQVTQTKEKYFIVAPTGYLCLDESGKVLSLKKKKLKDNQFRLEGFEPQTANVGEQYTPEGENEMRFSAAQKIVSLLEKNGLTKANVLDLTDLGRIVICFEERINIYLNGTDKLEEKIGLVAGVIHNDITENSRGYIDARFEHRVFFNENSMTID